MTDQARTTWRLFSTGVLPWWAAALLAAAGVTAAVVLLRGELGRRRGRGGAWAGLLYLTRPLIVLLVGLLVLQPVLFIRRESVRPGVLALVADRSASMLRTDRYAAPAAAGGTGDWLRNGAPSAVSVPVPIFPTGLLDLAAAMHAPAAAGREVAAEDARRELAALEPMVRAWQRDARAIQDELAQGMPWSPAFQQDAKRDGEQVAAATARVRRMVDGLGALEGRLTRRRGENASAPAAPSAQSPLAGAAPVSTAPAAGGGRVAEVDGRLFAASYDLPERLGAVRRELAAAGGGALDDGGAERLGTACDALAAAWQAAGPAMDALQAACDARLLATMPKADRQALEGLGKLSRFELARRLARQLAGDAALAGRHRVRLMGFEDLPPGEASRQTDLLAAIDRASTACLDEAVSGVVLFSDGRQNLPERPDVLRRLTGRDARLITAGVGVAGELPHVAMTDYRLDGAVLAGAEAVLTTRLKTAVPKGTPIRVELARDGGGAMPAAGARPATAGRQGPVVVAWRDLQADGGDVMELTMTFRVPGAGEGGGQAGGAGGTAGAAVGAAGPASGPAKGDNASGLPDAPDAPAAGQAPDAPAAGTGEGGVGMTPGPATAPAGEAAGGENIAGGTGVWTLTATAGQVRGAPPRLNSAPQTVRASGGERITTSPQPAPADGATAAAPPEALGAPEQAGDPAPDNDRVVLAPAVLARPACVLVVAQWARWDVVHVLAALAHKPCRVDVALWGQAKDGKPPRGAGPGQVPADLAALRRYDLIVLAGRPFGGMTAKDGELLARYVVQGGGTLLVVRDGRDWYGPALGGLLAPAAGVDSGPAPAAGPGLGLGEGGRLAPPAGAEAMPAVALSADAAKARGAWAALAEPRAIFAVPDQSVPLLVAGAEDSGAGVLGNPAGGGSGGPRGQADSAAAAEHGGPGAGVLTVGFYGRGKVYALGLGDLYRLREWTGAEAAGRLLGNLLDEAIQPLFRDGSAKVAIYPAAPPAGTETLILLDSAGKPPPATGRVTWPGGPGPTGGAASSAGGACELKFAPLADWSPRSPARAAWPRSGAAGGLLVAAFRPPLAGAITVELPGLPALAATVTSAVSREDIDFSLDPAELERLARDGGGRYVPLPDVARAVAELPARPDRHVTVREIRLWNLWWLLPAVAALMAADWFLRRRSGLVM